MFGLSAEQQMLHDMVTRLAADRHPFGARRAVISAAEPWIPEFWSDLADQGLLGAGLPYENSGFDGGPSAISIVQHVFGRHLVLSPYMSTALAARFISRVGDERQQGEWLPSIISGDCVVSLALQESNSAGLGSIHTVAELHDDGYRLKGRKQLVVNAGASDRLLVAARITGSGTIAAFLIDTRRAGVALSEFATIDGGRAAEIELRDVAVSVGESLGDNLSDELEQLCDEAAVGLASDACGSIGMLLDATVAYSRTRRQFGQPIGSFQVLQHRMVDMLVARDQANAITWRAATMLGAAPLHRMRAASAAKAQVGRLGRKVAQAAVQIHGAIGTTDELDVSHHFRRVELADLHFGSAAAHLRRYEKLLDAGPVQMMA